MGKKRTRVPGQPRANSKVATDGLLQHRQTLEDDVREQIHPHVAVEKRQIERTKRRRMSEDPEDSHQPSEIPTSNARRVDARAAGLDMWRKAAARRRSASGQKDGLSEGGLDQKTNAKILEEARVQRAQLREEGLQGTTQQETPNPLSASADKNMDDGDAESGSDGETAFGDGLSNVGDEDMDLDFLDGSKITEDDELALNLFSKTKVAPEQQPSEPRLMLADIILAKIQEKEEADAAAAEAAANPEKVERERKIAEVYGLVGNIMSRYRSGKVPKAFKVIPKMPNWQHLVHLTRPDEWSPASCFVATRILASNLPAKELLPFYTDILLPRCLEDISDNKKLNYHLYHALIKSIYKPDAFCKGILFAMCEDDMVTLRQATIISSVVAKVSIPMLHSAAALLYLSQLPFSPTTCLVMTAIIEKKYALPYRVVDAVVDSFARMKEDNRPMPLIWHKCLLAFAQRYKMELTMEQKTKLKLLMRVHTHVGVTPEVRRELFSARNRGDLMDPDANTIALNMQESAMVD